MKKLLLSFLLMAIGCAINAYADTYQLVTDASALANGDEVIVVAKNGTSYYAMSPNVKSSKITSAEVTCVGNDISLESNQTDVQIFTLESKEAAPTDFALRQKGGSNYVVKGSGNTDTKYGTNPTYKSITISSDGAADIYVNTSRKLRFWANAKDFRGYSDNSGIAVSIYRLVVEQEGNVATPTISYRQGGLSLVARWSFPALLMARRFTTRWMAQTPQMTPLSMRSRYLSTRMSLSRRLLTRMGKAAQLPRQTTRSILLTLKTSRFRCHRP